MPSQEGLALFDAALACGEPVLAPMRLDHTTLTGDTLPLLRALVRTPRPTPPSGEDTTFRQRLARATGTERNRLLTDLIRKHAADVLGHNEAVDASRGFMDLGFDSLMAVELRNRLGTVMGLRLPATTLFDHPSPLALAEHLSTESVGQSDGPGANSDLFTELGAVETMVTALPSRDPVRTAVRDRMRALLASWDEQDQEREADKTDLDSAGLDEMLAIIDDELENS
jgi:acyl carrier protein